MVPSNCWSSGLVAQRTTWDSWSQLFATSALSGVREGFSCCGVEQADRLICTPGSQDAMIVALERGTGQMIWKCTVPEIGENGADGAAFSSIVISEAAGVRQYIQMTGRGLVGVDSDTGRFLWGYNDIANDTANIPRRSSDGFGSSRRSSPRS